VATASTTYNEPYILARKFASLDHISGGRAGWNLVTSGNEAEAFNFGREEHLAHGDRYRRAGEFLDVARGLWDSWEDDAFVRDKATGVFFDPEKVYRLDHRGEFFGVRGPLNIPRSPQGWPVLVQAGSSGPGKALAGASAEVVFTAQQTLADAQAFYRDVKAEAIANGRSPDDVKIMPGIFPVVGRTREEAEAKFEALQNLIHPDVALSILEHRLGVPLRHLPHDAPVPTDIPLTNAARSRQTLLLELAEREKLSILQLALRVAGARGHWQVTGTPEEIVDVMEERFLNDGADGFNIMPPHLPGGLDDFIALVVPELQRRGLFRTEYEGRTLRDHLGLRRPGRRHRHNRAIDAA
jgi:FMN-dependent oxidoreductase (nitrilotriacetate monooxygenase family)